MAVRLVMATPAVLSRLAKSRPVGGRGICLRAWPASPAFTSRLLPSTLPLPAAVLRRSLASAPAVAAPRPRKGAAALSLKELRLVSKEGSVGVMPPEEAVRIAEERGMELVEVSPRASPPVWRLVPPPDPAEEGVAEEVVVNEAPREPEVLIRRKPRPGKPPKPLKVKEVRLTDKIDPRDAQTKAEYALKFLHKGHVVKVIALNTGQTCEATQRPKAQSLVELICETCAEVASASNTQTGGQGGRMQRNTIGVVSATLTPLSKLEGKKS